MESNGAVRRLYRTTYSSPRSVSAPGTSSLAGPLGLRVEMTETVDVSRDNHGVAVEWLEQVSGPVPS